MTIQRLLFGTLVLVLLSNTAFAQRSTGADTGDRTETTKLATLNSSVFDDLDGDGLRSKTELGLAGVNVALLQTDAKTGATREVAMVTTEADGRYSLADLDLGTYSLRYDFPVAKSVRLKAVPDVAEGDVIFDPLTRESSLFELDGATVPVIRASVEVSSGIRGLAWADDGDGVRAEAEQGVAGVPVELFTAIGEKVAETMSGEKGSVNFDGLDSGDYFVRIGKGEVSKALVSIASNEKQAGIDALTRTSSVFSVPEKAVFSGLAIATEEGAEISGLLFEDRDLDGLKSEAEKGFKDFSVRLLGEAGRVLEETLTSKDGSYSFKGLSAGNYQVQVAGLNEAGLTPVEQGAGSAEGFYLDVQTGTTGSIELATGQTIDNVRSGVTSGRALEASVFFDENADGKRGLAESTLVGLKIRVLSSAGELVAEGVSNSEGVLTTSPVRSGIYTIEAVAPAGFSLTAQDVGSDDSIDSDVDPETGTVLNVVVGEDGLSDFGVGLIGTENGSTAVKRSPLAFHWNSFLDQTNILSVFNKTEVEATAIVKVFASDSTLIAETPVVLGAKAQRDLILNDLDGFEKDRVGFAMIEFDEDNDLDASLTRYKANDPVGGFDFTVTERSKSLRSGNSSVSFNTFNPDQSETADQSGSMNWVSVSNPDPVNELQITRKLFGTDGTMLDSLDFTVPPLSRVDVEAGHESLGQNLAGAVSLIPASLTAQYHAIIDRYGVKIDDRGMEISFASSSPARACLKKQMSKQFSTLPGTDSWMALSNVGDNSAMFKVIVEDVYGAISEEMTVQLPANGQQHILLDQITEELQVTGMVIVVPMSEGACAIFDVTNYAYNMESGEVSEVADGTERLPEPGVTFAAYNTFLGQENWLRLASTDETVGDGRAMVYNAEGVMVAEVPFWIGPDFQTDVNLMAPPYNLPADTYGMVEIRREVSTLQGTILADVTRVMRNEGGTIDTLTTLDLE